VWRVSAFPKPASSAVSRSRWTLTCTSWMSVRDRHAALAGLLRDVEQ
jgi:hypothetical protein